MAVNPALLDIPDHFLTPRLRVGAPAVGEGAEVNAAVRESFEQLRLWMPWAKEMPSIDDSETYSRESAAAFIARKDLPMRLRDRETGQIVGSSGLHPRDWEVPSFEVGYWCRTSRCGQGFVTEAVRGITQYAFEILHARRLELHSDTANAASRRVAERAGFTQEGALRDFRRGNDGTLRSVVIYAILRDDYPRIREEHGFEIELP